MKASRRPAEAVRKTTRAVRASTASAFTKPSKSVRRGERGRLRVEKSREREDDVRGGDRRAVLPAGVLSEANRVDEMVGRGGNLLREARHEVQLLVVVEQVPLEEREDDLLGIRRGEDRVERLRLPVEAAPHDALLALPAHAAGGEEHESREERPRLLRTATPRRPPRRCRPTSRTRIESTAGPAGFGTRKTKRSTGESAAPSSAGRRRQRSAFTAPSAFVTGESASVARTVTTIESPSSLRDSTFRTGGVLSMTTTPLSSRAVSASLSGCDRRSEARHAEAVAAVRERRRVERQERVLELLAHGEPRRTALPPRLHLVTQRVAVRVRALPRERPVALPEEPPSGAFGRALVRGLEARVDAVLVGIRHGQDAGPGGAAREDGARLEDGEVLEHRPRVPLRVRKLRRARRPAIRPSPDAVRSAFHWKKRATGGFAPPSGPTGIQADQVASGFSDVPRPHGERDGPAPAGTPALARSRPNVDRRKRVLDGGRERAGRRPARRRGPQDSRRSHRDDREARRGRGDASDSFSPVEATSRHTAILPRVDASARAGRDEERAARGRGAARKRTPRGRARPARRSRPAAIATISELFVERRRGGGSRRRRRSGDRDRARGALPPARPGGGVGVGEGRSARLDRGRPARRSVELRGRRVEDAACVDGEAETSGREKSCSVRGLPSGRSRRETAVGCARVHGAVRTHGEASGRGRPRSRGRARARPPAVLR